nr:hypothetical protein Iba_chr06aCG10100 [Ipomoea batatas]
MVALSGSELKEAVEGVSLGLKRRKDMEGISINEGVTMREVSMGLLLAVRVFFAKANIDVNSKSIKNLVDLSQVDFEAFNSLMLMAFGL